jgi:hypothetical protein
MPNATDPDATKIPRTPLYDNVGHQVVAARAVNVSQDSAGIWSGDESTSGGGGGSGGAVTVADGADVAQGTTTDVANAATVVGQLKQINVNLADTLADGDTLASIKTDLDSVVTNTADLLVDGDNLASILTQVTNHNVSQVAAQSVNGTLQSAQSGNAVGTPLTVLGMSSAVLTVNMTGFTGTVNFEGQEDGTNFSSLSVTQLGTSTIGLTTVGSTTTAIRIFECAVGGLQQIQARTSGVSAGTVTVTAHAVPVTFGPRTINANQVNGPYTVSRSTVAAYSLASTVTTGSTQNSGDIAVGPYTEISIDITTTAQAGTAPTIQYFYERKAADGIYYVLWQSAVLTAAANTISTSIGTGQAYNQSLGVTGRLRWVVGGSATPTFTHSANIQGK